MTEQHHSEEMIFEQARRLASSQDRLQFVEQTCGGDAQLKRRILALLAAHEVACGPLDALPPGIGATLDNAPERAGIQVGPYQLIEQIGEGGMGTVWMAQQIQPVKRLVAIKLIKAGMDSRQVIARFEAERQALAIMDHANIARVLDAGTTSAGRPYFVMDLVKGVPITKYCDENHLTQRQRLELMVPVCQAVQHAHQKGVIHRDLKPSNVLVALADGQPVPKIIDFGVAKATGQPLTEETLETGLGNIVGTLEYMSPEQAEFNQLDIDTRSDIYSLGVLLYELLTGAPPFSRTKLEKAGMLEMLRVIREEEPSKPSTKLSQADGLPTLAANRGTEPARLTKLVRGELDWIVMKALEKDRSRRYETAAGFAADLRRYLNDDPVHAGPPSVWYRLRKFARRNKGILAAAAMLGLALLVCVSAIGWTVRDRIARRAEAQRDLAARQARLTGQLQLILAQVARLEGQQKWPEALEAALRASDLVAGGGADAATEKQVRSTISDLQLVQLLDDIRASRGESFNESHFDYGLSAERYAEAFSGADIDLASLALADAAQRFRSHSEVLAALIPTLDDWAICYQLAGKERQAEGVWEVAGLVDPDTLRQQIRLALRAKDDAALQTLAESRDVARQSAVTLNLLETALRQRGRLEAALDVLTKAQRNHPTDFWIHYGMAQAATNRTPPSPEQAAGCYRAALALRPRSASAWNSLGIALKAQNKFDDAIACFDRAIELDPKFFMAHANLGFLRYKQGNREDAIACWRRSLDLYPKTPMVFSNLGSVLQEQGNIDEAIDCFHKAIALAPKFSVAHFNLGIALAKQQKLDEAMVSYRAAIEIDPKFVLAHQRLASLLFSKGDFEKAIEVIQKVISLQPELSNPHHNLGAALNYLGRQQEAIASHRQAIRLKPNYLEAHISLSRLLTTCADPQLRDPEDALQLARKAIELAPQSTDAWLALGWALYRGGEWKASIEAIEKSLAIGASPTGGNAEKWIVLALANHQLGDREAAREWHRQAVERIEKNQPQNQELHRFRVEAEELINKP